MKISPGDPTMPYQTPHEADYHRVRVARAKAMREAVRVLAARLRKADLNRSAPDNDT
jgi:hypothetical protein